LAFYGIICDILLALNLKGEVIIMRVIDFTGKSLIPWDFADIVSAVFLNIIKKFKQN